MALVSVVLPIYRYDRFLVEAVESILGQTLKDLELLVIAEFGTDPKCFEVLDRFRDPRIKTIKNETRLGLTLSLNRGLEVASGEFIARMDSDDVSLSERFARQVKCLNENEGVVLCGTWAYRIGASIPAAVRPPSSSDELKFAVGLCNPIVHPSVMFRGSFIRETKIAYDTTLLHSEDFDLWVRTSSKFPIMNVPEILLLYRMHASNLTESVLSRDSGDTNIKIFQRAARRFNIHEDTKLFRSWVNIHVKYFTPSFEDLANAESLLLQIKNWVDSSESAPSIKRNMIGDFWFFSGMACSNLNLTAWKYCRTSPLWDLVIRPWWKESLFFIFCLMGARNAVLGIFLQLINFSLVDFVRYQWLCFQNKRRATQTLAVNLSRSNSAGRNALQDQ